MRYLVIGVIWLAAAIGVSAAGLLTKLHPPAPQLVLLALTAMLVIASRTSVGFRAWLTSLGWRPVVSYHLIRFVGLYFIYLYNRGELPYAFAVPGGIGDAIVAALAAVLLMVYASRTPPSGALFIWNLLGLVDIFFVVSTAARLAIDDPSSMSALQHLPLSLLITFIVPVVIASHIWLFFSLRRKTVA